jgi:hypothetical protein
MAIDQKSPAARVINVSNRLGVLAERITMIRDALESTMADNGHDLALYMIESGSISQAVDEAVANAKATET